MKTKLDQQDLRERNGAGYKSMRDRQAKPTETFYALQRANREKAHHMKQLENLVIQQRLLIEEMCSVACAWAFDEGRGVPHLTDDEIMRIINETSQPPTPGDNKNA